MYRARFDHLGGNWVVEQEIPCINGLAAWFCIAILPDDSAEEEILTDGKYGTAEERATKIAEALNAVR